MTFKDLIEKTKGIFYWDVEKERVFDKKTNSTIEAPVYTAYYRGWYCGYWYKGTFYMFEMLDGTDEEMWLDRDDQTLYTSTKKVLAAIPLLNQNVKILEQFMKEQAIKQDFE